MGFFTCVAPSLPLKKTWARVVGSRNRDCGCNPIPGLATDGDNRAHRLPMSIEGAWFIGVYLVEVLTFINYSTLFLVLSRRVDRSAEADRHEAELRRLARELLAERGCLHPDVQRGARGRRAVDPRRPADRLSRSSRSGCLTTVGEIGWRISARRTGRTTFIGASARTPRRGISTMGSR